MDGENVVCQLVDPHLAYSINLPGALNISQGVLLIYFRGLQSVCTSKI